MHSHHHHSYENNDTHDSPTLRIPYPVSRILPDVTMFYNVILRGQPLQITNTIWQRGIRTPHFGAFNVLSVGFFPTRINYSGGGWWVAFTRPPTPTKGGEIPPTSGGLLSALGKGCTRCWDSGNRVAKVKIWSSRWSANDHYEHTFERHKFWSTTYMCWCTIECWHN